MKIPYDAITSLVEAYKALDEASIRGDKDACKYLVGVVIAEYRDVPRLDAVETAVLRSRILGALPEPTSIEEFLGLHERSLIVGLSDRSREEAKTEWVPPSVVKVPVDEALRARAKAKRVGLFYTPNSVRGDTHNDEDVAEYRYFFLDFDGGNKEKPFVWMEKHNLVPTFIVDTKNGLHAYYRLHPNSLKEEKWRSIEGRLVDSSGADTKARNPARLLRLPWTWHGKEDPYLCKIVSWNGTIYDWELFDEKFPEQKPKTFVLSPSFQPRRSAPEPEPMVLSRNERHGGLVEQAAKAYAKIKEQPELARPTRENIVYWYGRSQSPQKPDWEYEANSVCDHIERRQYGSVVSR